MAQPSGPPDVMPILSSLGWTWYDNGAVVRTTIDGVEHQVWVPLRYIWALFHQELQQCGCPLAQEVGAPFTSVGFFKSISRAVKRGFRKAGRAVKRTVRGAKRTVRRVRRRARRTFRRVVPRRLRRAARRVGRLAKRIARKTYKVVTSRQAQAVMAGLGVAIPAIAPAAAAIVAAQEGLRHIDAGVKAAKAIQRGVKATAGMVRAMRRGARTKATIDARARAARQGNRSAQEFMGALAQLAGT